MLALVGISASPEMLRSALSCIGPTPAETAALASFLHDSPSPVGTAAVGGAGLPAAATSTSPDDLKDPSDGCTSNHRCVTQEALQEAEDLAGRVALLGVPPGDDDGSGKDGGGEDSGNEDNADGSIAESPAAASVDAGAGCAGPAAPVFGAITSTPSGHVVQLREGPMSLASYVANLNNSTKGCCDRSECDKGRRNKPQRVEPQAQNHAQLVMSQTGSGRRVRRR